MRAPVVLCIAATLTFVGAAAASDALQPLAMWGSAGGAPGQFNVANGIAVDDAGHVYVADELNNRVQEFDAGGRLLKVIGTPGDGDGQLAAPYGVAVDGFGDLYVADTNNNRIQKFSPAGRFLAAWGGVRGAGDGQFASPRGVAVDDAGNVYVADHDNNRVVKLSSTGRFLAAWGAHGADGTAGRRKGEFSEPRGLAVDHSGHVYVAEKLNHRIQELTTDGRFVRRWGSHRGDGTPGLGNGEFDLPYTVAIDGAGNLYVADVLNNRIQKFSPDGRFIARYGHNGGDGTAGAAPGEFNEPYGVATDCRSTVYVSEEGNARVQKLGVPGGPPPRCAPKPTVTAVAARDGRLRATVACDRPCAATLTVRSGGAATRTVRRDAIRRGRPAHLGVALPRAARTARVTVVVRGIGGRAPAVRRRVIVGP